ncbi:MAG: ATPase [Chitinophagaceae bacterium]|nr:MAG: ATPase [Chitinophagaceae bacterium]
MPRNISSILINAPAARVWTAITEPASVKQWQFGSDVITDWKPGSSIRFRTEWIDTVFEQWGEIIEVIPRELLRYSLYAPGPGREDKPEFYFIMNYILHEEGAATRLEIVQEDNRPGAIQEDPQGEENPILAGLKSLVENNP